MIMTLNLLRVAAYIFLYSIVCTTTASAQEVSDRNLDIEISIERVLESQKQVRRDSNSQLRTELSTALPDFIEAVERFKYEYLTLREAARNSLVTQLKAVTTEEIAIKITDRLLKNKNLVLLRSSMYYNPRFSESLYFEQMLANLQKYGTRRDVLNRIIGDLKVLSKRREATFENLKKTIGEQKKSLHVGYFPMNRSECRLWDLWSYRRSIFYGYGRDVPEREGHEYGDLTYMTLAIDKEGFNFFDNPEKGKLKIICHIDTKSPFDGKNKVTYDKQNHTLNIYENAIYFSMGTRLYPYREEIMSVLRSEIYKK